MKKITVMEWYSVLRVCRFILELAAESTLFLYYRKFQVFIHNAIRLL